MATIYKTEKQLHKHNFSKQIEMQK